MPVIDLKSYLLGRFYLEKIEILISKKNMISDVLKI